MATSSAEHGREAAAQFAALNGQPLHRLRSPFTLLAAVWTLWAVFLTRRRLRRGGLAARVPAPPPRLPWGARSGVNMVLGRLDSTCLEHALVMQRWLLANGVAFDVVVGVRRGAEAAVSAHAWIAELTHPDEVASYAVIHTIAPRS